MSQVSAYLRFNDGKCKEAMTFYKECIGGELEMQTVAESPMAKDMPQNKDKIMHASLKKGDIMILGSDMMRDKAVVGDNIALAYNGDSEKEIRSLFEKFSKDGEVFMPLEIAFWGGLFGVVTDKFGIEWMFNYQKA